MTTSAPEAITLKGGLVVALPALQLAWQLEARGIDLRIGENGHLLVGPSRLLTYADQTAIASHKPELIGLTHYCDEVRA